MAGTSANINLLPFFGWNTYENGLKNKLYAYLSGGGSVIISYCHFNKTDNAALKFAYADDAVEELCGVKASGTATTYSAVELDGERFDLGGVNLLSASVTASENSAEPYVTDVNGNVIFYRKNVGGGVLYFATFADYNGDNAEVVRLIKRVTEKISYGVCSSHIDNGNVAYTERVADNGDRIFGFMNMSSKSVNTQEFTLTVVDGGKKHIVPLSVDTDEIKEYIFKK